MTGAAAAAPTVELDIVFLLVIVIIPFDVALPSGAGVLSPCDAARVHRVAEEPRAPPFPGPTAGPRRRFHPSIRNPISCA
jgi:hypothetical protein